jgi:hypothetical protein
MMVSMGGFSDSCLTISSTFNVFIAVGYSNSNIKAKDS